MRYSKEATLAICVLLVTAVGLYYYQVARTTSPNPSTTELSTDTPSCSPSPTCNGFTISSANLTVVAAEDVTSQLVTLWVVPSGTMPVTRFVAYLGNALLGQKSGPFQPGVGYLLGFGIPTTINVTRGQYYKVYLQAVYTDTSGAVQGDYWQLAFAFAR